MEKVIIVAEADVHAYLTQTYPNWDTQVPATTVNALWEGLNDGSLSGETSIIVFSDHYFDPSGRDEELELAIATMAPNALVMVIEYEPNTTNLIREKVNRIAVRDNMEQAPYYILHPETVEEDVEDALAAYSAARQGSEDVASSAGALHVEFNAAPDEDSSEDVRQGMIITVTSSKGGSGKSTTSLCFANALVRSSQKAVEAGKAERPLDIVVVDMDVRDGQLGFFINQTSPTALNIRTEPDWSVDIIRRYLVEDTRLGVHFLLAPKQARSSDDVPAAFYKDIIGKLRTMFDIVILDTSVNYLDPRLSQVCYPMADAMLFVTDLGVSSVFGMNRWIAEVTSPAPGGMGIDPSLIGVVVNKSMTGVNMDKTKVMSASNNVPLLVAIPSKPELYVSMANQHSMDRLLDDPEIGGTYFRLAHKVVGPHYPLVNFVQAQQAPQPQQGGGQPQQAPQPQQGGYNQPQQAPPQGGGMRVAPVGGQQPQGQPNYPGYSQGTPPKKKKGFFGKG